MQQKRGRTVIGLSESKNARLVLKIISEVKKKRNEMKTINKNNQKQILICTYYTNNLLLRSISVGQSTNDRDCKRNNNWSDEWVRYTA